jgi:Iron-sulfur cluster binding domain of dihydroorotate dehydrogenase B
VCFTCVCPLKQSDGSFKNKRTCLEGPVLAFDRLPAVDRW